MLQKKKSQTWRVVPLKTLTSWTGYKTMNKLTAAVKSRTNLARCSPIGLWESCSKLNISEFTESLTFLIKNYILVAATYILMQYTRSTTRQALPRINAYILLAGWQNNDNCQLHHEESCTITIYIYGGISYFFLYELLRCRIQWQR